MTIDRARRLRRDATDAEKVLWRALRSHRLHGVKFRRQAPIGPYIVDFVDFAEKVIVEVDGGQHATEDPARQRFLEAEGFRVVRFWNHDVLANPDGVLRTIADAVDRA